MAGIKIGDSYRQCVHLSDDKLVRHWWGSSSGVWLGLCGKCHREYRAKRPIQTDPSLLTFGAERKKLMLGSIKR